MHAFIHSYMHAFVLKAFSYLVIDRRLANITAVCRGFGHGSCAVLRARATGFAAGGPGRPVAQLAVNGTFLVLARLDFVFRLALLPAVCSRGDGGGGAFLGARAARGGAGAPARPRARRVDRAPLRAAHLALSHFRAGVPKVERGLRDDAAALTVLRTRTKRRRQTVVSAGVAAVLRSAAEVAARAAATVRDVHAVGDRPSGGAGMPGRVGDGEGGEREHVHASASHELRRTHWRA